MSSPVINADARPPPYSDSPDNNIRLLENENLRTNTQRNFSDEIDSEAVNVLAQPILHLSTNSSHNLGPPTPPQTPPPFEPRRYVNNLFGFEEIIIFFLYPCTILLGSLVSIISGVPESYFGNKTNFFNVFFVKNGWFWTTIVFTIHATRLRITSPRGLFVRYIAAAGWWFLFTQWFFGPPIMDRVFLTTGGVCFVKDVDEIPGQERPIHDVWSSIGCRHASGEWSGGHDISGHSFLLTHSSLFLWYEVLPVVLEGGTLARELNTKIVFALLTLWWWMLLMTGIYFHTFQEKVTGWLCGLFAWAFIYLVSPRISTLKRVVGVPGV
ncbi:inositol phospholipid synthesis and fat-storage-inducing TM-domain-containing protein [Lipomyces japonicus]|uniref:inositol phospholipid synthesis and fat-storage-inducing TM-domain-containing protein n=1 Tax=Lipomyces japonicus TaxID=56871 RepID=UPI0034CE5EE9